MAIWRYGGGSDPPRQTLIAAPSPAPHRSIHRARSPSQSRPCIEARRRPTNRNAVWISILSKEFADHLLGLRSDVSADPDLTDAAAGHELQWQLDILPAAQGHPKAISTIPSFFTSHFNAVE